VAFPAVLTSGNKALRATTMDVRLEALPPWHVKPPARGPVKPNRLAREREVCFSMTDRAGDT